MHTGRLIHPCTWISSAPTVRCRDARIGHTFVERCEEISMFFAFWAPICRLVLERTIARQPKLLTVRIRVHKPGLNSYAFFSDFGKKL